MTRFSLTLFFILVSWVSHAQRYTFLSYSTAQGLPQSQVTSIAQDENGFLWVGTLGGLAKFNGKDFESFTSEDGLLNNRITFLSFINGQLWIGHEGGVSKMGVNGFSKWSLSSEERKTNVSDIVEFDGRIIFSTNGAGMFSLIGNKLTPIKIPGEDHERVRDFEIHNNFIFAGTRAGVFYSDDLKVWTAIQGTEDFNISSIKKHNGGIYISTMQDGLFKYDPIQKKIERVGGIDFPQTLRFCYFDSNDRLWINTYDGIWRLKGTNTELKLNEGNGLPMEAIQAVFEDKNGNIWFGSEGKGLLRFTGERFVYFDQSTGLTSDLVLSVNQDENGTFWLGTFDKGLVRMGNRGDISNIEIGNNTVWCSILDVDGLNWFGTGEGLIGMDGTKVTKEYFQEEGTPGNKITALLKVSSNSFYVGGSNGVSFYQKGTIRPLKGKLTETVRSFCKVGNKIYCATDKGLFVIKDGRTHEVGSFSNTIYSLVSDNEGKLWVGTEEGLFVYDGTLLKNISFSKDPASNFINFLVRRDNTLFVGTNNGLYMLKSLDQSKPTVVKYGIGEGVVNLETNLNSSFIDKKGRLWFGTASGLVCFRPEYESGVISFPSLVLKNILINYQQVDFTNFTDQIDKFGMPANLDLPYSKNNISFELEGIALANYPGMQFQFRLEGLEGGWSPPNNNTNITYNALPAGDYIFHGRCIDSRGKFSEEILIPFTIRQAFYRTWWFFLICGTILGLLVIGAFRVRLTREREANEKERLEYKSRLLTLEQRSLNASMNRHFIFNSLNSIQYFINTQDKLSANRFLTNFAKLIRKNLDSSEEGNMVTLSQEIERLDLYLSLESMRFKDRFDYKIDCDPAIDLDAVVIPAMILQPFVENSIIHGILPDESKKGNIQIKIYIEEDNMVIEITDNGIGIDQSKKGKSDYDGDHRSQGMEITSKRIELLNKLSDRKFEIKGPFQIEDNYHLIKGTGVILKMQLENLED
jgi:ligand-binding sensor domain-containing protein/two-component sensor histidine kinase